LEDKKTIEKLFEINPAEWKNEVADIEGFFKKCSRIPKELWEELKSLSKRITD